MEEKSIRLVSIFFDPQPNDSGINMLALDTEG